MKPKYLVFDLFGTITKSRYLPAVLGWYMGSKKPVEELIDKEFVEIIKLLSRRYQLCILSNANHHFVKGSLQKSHLSKYFKYVVISSESGVRKPSKAAFYKLIDLGVEPQISLFIDDRDRNLYIADTLGFSTLRFKNKADLAQKLRRLNHV